jgi:toxin ParE1/3/4
VSYRILFQPPAARELDEVFGWIARRSPGRATAWQVGAIERILTLTELPRCCPLAPEARDTELEIRQLMYGDYRILFTIEEDVVNILRIRHGARRPLPPDHI